MKMKTDKPPSGLIRTVIILAVVLAVGLPRSLRAQVPAPDLYTAEHEASPRVDQYYTEKFRATAQQQQEGFRQRIAIPDAVSEAVPVLTASRAAREPSTAARSAEPSSWGRGVMLAGLFGLGGLLLVRRLFPDPVLERRTCSAWSLLPGGPIPIAGPKAR